uniref:Protein YIPF n=1 Tax=Hemiselmis tepida TaxID=464990 RepID=A0A7S0W2L3_9CRYP|mmetsp:Transcript_37826/g.96696  ORF Transcript_37826/g.96696 Transcript_37826/m.96696 type:complete len:189 (+) Transcript_37826:44-610(+)
MSGGVSIEDEPPLLEELGIDFSKIYQKTVSVLNPMVKVTEDMMYTRNQEGKLEPDNDLAGPILIALMLGASMMLRGKLQFGSIYGLGVVGCTSLWLVMTLMSKRGIDIYQTASILGYCLLPMVLLAFFSVFFSATGPIMTALATGVVGWCSWRSSDMFTVSMDAHNEKALIAYPVGLFYAGFALLAVF